MTDQNLRTTIIDRILPRVQTPGQYIGGEWNSVRKDPASVRGRLCLAFPDTYSIGMSCCGLQVLYAVINGRPDWSCQRVFAPLTDMEALLREQGLPLCSLEDFTPLAEFDVLGFTLQYDLCYANVLNMLDLANIPLAVAERDRRHPLVIAGGPCAANPEPMARFIDLFLLGDGEEALPAVCDLWLELKDAGLARAAALVEMARRLPYAYVPQCYEPQYGGDGRQASVRPLFSGVPERIEPAVVADLEDFPLPAAPIVPQVECVQDRITIEIMRGCPWRCRFCQSTTTKRPVRFRKVETIVAAAVAAYRNTGYNEVSLLGLSTGDYPQIEELLRRLQETFRPLNVSVSLPSLRVNQQLALLGDLLNTDRRDGLTLAPEAALDPMRRRIGKEISNDDLYEGCRRAMANGFARVKLYFMCGLPGEEEADLDGILDMAETVSRLGKECGGRFATVSAAVANFVPKPQTPFQWQAMQRREYFAAAHERLRRRQRFGNVTVRCHSIESSLLEGVLSRGDRRVAAAIELAFRRGARFDAWNEQLRADLWHQAFSDAGVNVEQILHEPYAADAVLPWDHLGIRQGREYLEKEGFGNLGI